MSRAGAGRLFLLVAFFFWGGGRVVVAQQGGEYGAGSPIVMQNSSGHLEVFRIDAQGELYHKWQKDAYEDWSLWVSLGGWMRPEFTVIKERDGRLGVFAVDKMSGNVRYKVQADPTRLDLDWSFWSSIGGNAMFKPPPVAGLNADGRLEVFGLDAVRGTLRHVWQTNFTNVAGWTKWADLPGKIEPGFVVGNNQDGRLELFGIELATGDLVHCYQVQANEDEAWSPWLSLRGGLTPNLTVTRLPDGRLEILGVNRTNLEVNCVFQLKVNATDEWSAWASLGGKVKGGLAVGQRPNGCLEIFAVNADDGTMLHNHQTKVGDPDSWSDWESIGGSLRPSPAVGRNPDGNLEVFAGDRDNPATLNHRRQISNNNGWLDWLNMDQPVFQYASRTWQIVDGLPHNEVRAIAQTPDGYLWVGTPAGLARFDGINFQTFDAKNTPELKNNSVSALCVDRDGGMWVGTEGGGVVCLKGGVFTHFGQTDGLAGDTVNAIYEGTDGVVWIGTTAGMSRYENGQFVNYTQKDGLLSTLVRSIFADQEGSLWIATDQGLNCWGRDGSRRTFTTANGLPRNSVRTIYVDRGNRLWIGTDNGMAFYNDGRFYSFDTEYGLADRVVSAICGDHLGNLWVGTYGGLNRFQGGRFLNELNNEGLPYDRVNTIFEDRQGNLWTGSMEGLIRFTPKRFFLYTKQQGLTHNNIMAAMEDHVRNLWIGTWGGGLDKLRGELETTFFNYTNDYVLSICEAYNGVWVGADFEGGLAKFNNGGFKYYTWKDGLIRASIRSLHEDRFLNLWAGTPKGLSRFTNGKFTNYTTLDGLAGNDVRVICEDAEGHLWFGTDGGLSRWQEGKFVNLTKKDGLSDNSVTAIYGDNQRNVWVGTEAGGLSRYYDGKFAVYTSKQGLFSDEIFEIIEDDYGWLWMSCSKGVFRVRKQDFDDFDQKKISAITSIAYGKADGLESAQCNGTGKPGVWRAWDGKLWFATTKGLVAVDPKIEIQATPPPVFIEELDADNKPVLADGTGLEKTARILSAGTMSAARADGPIRVPPGRGELEFRYTALNFQTPEKSRFKYKLEGLDLDWMEAGQRRTAHYNNIYPGKYRFCVIACNSDGVWNETGAALDIVVLPHFWQTWWFYALATLSGGGAVFWVARYLTKAKMQRKLELLKQQHAVERERGRIAKDIHDELGSSLTRIMMLGERVQEDTAWSEESARCVKKMVASARSTVQSLDEIVWAVDPENDTLDGLVAYINQYTNQFFENTNIICRLEMPVELSAVSLLAEVRHDLFLVVKEGLNNILRHAKATEVRVRITENAPAMCIVIEDNGCGFDQPGSGTGRKGHGLENMVRRIADIGGQMTIESASGQGTRLKITVPLLAKQRPG